MPYVIRKTNGTNLLTIQDGIVDNSTALSLIGRSYTNYGELLADNFVRLMENFANATAPPNPIEGQIWYDSAVTEFKYWYIDPVTNNGSWANMAKIGQTGPTGYAGSAGTIGFTGYTGSEGIGYTGSQGTTGYNGSIGYSGSEGAGYTGSKGDTGYTGSSGLANLTVTDQTISGQLNKDIVFDPAGAGKIKFTGDIIPDADRTRSMGNSGAQFSTIYATRVRFNDGSTINTSKALDGAAVPASSIGAAGDKQGWVAFDASYMYYCMADYNGFNKIWTRVAWDGTW